MASGVISKPGNRWLVGLVVAATAITGGITVHGISNLELVVKQPTPQPTKLVVKQVTALGHLEPESKVLHLSAPQALDGEPPAEELR